MFDAMPSHESESALATGTDRLCFLEEWSRMDVYTNK